MNDGLRVVLFVVTIIAALATPVVIARTVNRHAPTRLRRVPWMVLSAILLGLGFGWVFTQLNQYSIGGEGLLAFLWSVIVFGVAMCLRGAGDKVV